jgi:hypothetical protein
MNSYIGILLLGIFIGAILGVFCTSLAAGSRDNVTVTYSGYQPKFDHKSIPPSIGSPVEKSIKRCPYEHTYCRKVNYRNICMAAGLRRDFIGSNNNSRKKSKQRKYCK